MNDYWSRVLGRRLSRRQILRTAAGAGLGLAGASLLACTPVETKPAATPTAAKTPTPAKPVSGGRLRFAIPSNPSGFDPATTEGGYDYYQFLQMYQNLAGLNPKDEPVPELAQSWEAPDPATYIFKLRKDVKFHDGAAFDAAAMKANYDRHRDPATKSRGVRQLELLNSFDVVDDYTVKYTLKKPSASIFYNVFVHRTSAIFSPKAVKDGVNLKTKGVGSGPFQFVDWVMDDHITLKKFPGYWEKDLPYLDEIYYRVIPDPTVQVTTLRTGEVDFLAEVRTQDLGPLKGDSNLNVMVLPGISWMPLYLNHKRADLDKKPLRQAIAYAIDREALSKIFNGILPPANAPLTPAIWAFDASVKGYPYDQAQAKAKLTEGGKPEGFKFDVLVSTAHSGAVSVAEAVKNQLAKVGITMNIQLLEQTTVIDRVLKGDADAWLSTTGGGSSDPNYLMMQFFHSSARLNLGRAKDSELDALIEKADTTYAREQARPLYSQMLKKVVDEVHAQIPLLYEMNLQATSKKVRNYVVYPDWKPRFKTVWLA
ncbi:MAG: ABC transporter substrate-binding protein [Chloroflexi bacterium]|nr:ABC transporter substrate-binding protein [Chloroflexota bacterium]